MRRHNFRDGNIIFREGDRSDAAYLITQGQVEILRTRQDGEEESLALLGEGEYFGEMGAIDDTPRSATAVARGPAVCMSVGQQEFMEMLLTRPQESIDLLKVLFARLRRTNEKLTRIRKGRGQ